MSPLPSNEPAPPPAEEEQQTEPLSLFTAVGRSVHRLKHRRIYQVLLAYLVGAWIALQVCSLVFSALDAPKWMIRSAFVLALAGLGLALLLGWSRERRAAGKTPLPAGLRALGFVLLALLPAVGMVAFFLSGRSSPPGGAQAPGATVAATTRMKPSEKSIAVLPFSNLSADQENAYFAEGVQDEILTDLAKAAELKVISRSSVMQYKSGIVRNLPEIAAQLGVAHVLEGSVQRAGNRVRVNAQLIDARTDTHLWAEHYDRPLDDVFAIQSEIAQAIAAQLQAHLSPQEMTAMTARPTGDMQAFDAYLRAQNIFLNFGADSVQTSDRLPEVERILHEALVRDPKFLLAWCLLARTHSTAYFQGSDHSAARLKQVEEAVQKAVSLNPDAGETHLALADYHYSCFRDYEKSRAELALARRTLPNSSIVYEYTGYTDRRQGRWTEALRNLERALELDPRNFAIVSQTSLTYQYQHRFADAARFYQRALTIVPGDPATRIFLAALEVDARADVRPYQAALATLLAEDPSLAPELEDPLYSLCERTPEAAARFLANTPRKGIADGGVVTPYAYWQGFVARWRGDAAGARAAFAAARTEVAEAVKAQPDQAAVLSLLGMIDAGLGNKTDAIAEGRRACELMPVSKDALDGSLVATNLAQTLAWCGEKTAAVEQIAAIEKEPNVLSYGLLKLHPSWDDLRGDPRFEALVASLAPKVAP